MQRKVREMKAQVLATKWLLLTGLLALVSTAQAQSLEEEFYGKGHTGPIRIPTSPRMQREKESERLIGSGKRLLDTDPQAAENAFRQAVSLALIPDEALDGLAQTLDRQGKDHDALAAYRSLTSSHTAWDSTLKREPRVLMGYTLAALKARQWPEAVQAYEAGQRNVGSISPSLPPLRAEFSPGNPEPERLAAMAHLALGVAAYKMTRFSQAADEFRQAAASDPSLALPNRYLGFSLRHIGKAVEAQAVEARADRLEHRK